MTYRVQIARRWDDDIEELVTLLVPAATPQNARDRVAPLLEKGGGRIVTVTKAR